MRSWVERSARSSTGEYTLGAQNLWEIVQKLHLAFKTYSWLWAWFRTKRLGRRSSEGHLNLDSQVSPYHLHNKVFGQHRLTSRSSF